MIKSWPLIRSAEVFTCPLFDIRIDTSLSPRTGKEHDFHIIDTRDRATVIPLTPASAVVMVKQFRHGLKDITIETPGGLVEPGDTPAETVQRELVEETGYQAQGVEFLGELYPQPALFTNRFFVYMGRDVDKITSPRQNEGEDIEVIQVPVQDIPEMIHRGEIRHALVLAAFHLYFLREHEGRFP